MRVVIGITCAYNVQEDWFYLRNSYVEGIIAAGGQPVLLPLVGHVELVSAYSQMIDGLLLSGGGDLDPAFFHQDPHPALGEISPERDIFELALVRKCLQQDQPVLGICRGIQVLNVAARGTIYQDLASEYPQLIQHHQKAPRYYPIHTIKVVKGTKLQQLFGREQLKVNSFHHQAVKEAASGFIISARTADGVIEAIESLHHRFIVGVQWHPEAMWRKYPIFLNLFKGLVSAAKEYHQFRKVR